MVKWLTVLMYVRSNGKNHMSNITYVDVKYFISLFPRRHPVSSLFLYLASLSALRAQRRLTSLRQKFSRDIKKGNQTHGFSNYWGIDGIFEMHCVVFRCPFVWDESDNEHRTLNLSLHSVRLDSNLICLFFYREAAVISSVKNGPAIVINIKLAFN